MSNDETPRTGMSEQTWLDMCELLAERHDAERRALAAEQALTEARAETERLNARLGECIGCEYDDGPDEFCPQHGRIYNDMVDMTQRCIGEARAERDTARAELAALRERIENACANAEDYQAIHAGTEREEFMRSNGLATITVGAVRRALAAPVEPQPTEGDGLPTDADLAEHATCATCLARITRSSSEWFHVTPLEWGQISCWRGGPAARPLDAPTKGERNG